MNYKACSYTYMCGGKHGWVYMHPDKYIQNEKLADFHLNIPFNLFGFEYGYEFGYLILNFCLSWKAVQMIILLI